MISKKILTQVSKQIQKEFTTINRCQRTAQRAQVLLQEQGIETRLVQGQAAWRVGLKAIAMIEYVLPDNLQFGEAQKYINEGKFHYWLEDDTNRILDFSTYNFRKVLAAMDKEDGEKKLTGLTWTPEYLYVKKSERSNLKSVRNSKTAGKFYYDEYVYMLVE